MNANLHTYSAWLLSCYLYHQYESIHILQSNYSASTVQRESWACNSVHETNPNTTQLLYMVLCSGVCPPSSVVCLHLCDTYMTIWLWLICTIKYTEREVFIRCKKHSVNSLLIVKFTGDDKLQVLTAIHLSLFDYLQRSHTEHHGGRSLSALTWENYSISFYFTPRTVHPGMHETQVLISWGGVSRESTS